MEDLRESLGLNRSVVAISIARMADGIGNSILFILIPLLIAKLPEPNSKLPLPMLVGIAISAYGFSASILQPLIAAFTDRWGRYKDTVEVGLVLLGLATAAFVFTRQYSDILVLRLLQGAGLALEIPASMALISLATVRETRGGSMGFYTTLRMVGLALGPIIGGFLHAMFGFNVAFLAATAILAGAVVVVHFGVEAVESRASSPAQKSPLFNWELFTPGILSVACATFVMATAFTLITTLENEFNQRLGTSAFGFSIGFSSLMIGRLLFQTPLGRLSDQIGRKAFVYWGLLVLGPITAMVGEASNLWEFSTLRFLQGVASAAIVAPALAYAGDVVQAGDTRNAGRQISIVTTGFGLGIAVGPLLAGFLASFFFRLPFWADGVLCVVTAWLVKRYMTETVLRT